MIAPRLEVDLDKIGHNARTLVRRLSSCGVSVTGVTKAALGWPSLASTLLRAGVSRIGDSRVENIEAMRRARVAGSMVLIRSPMISQASRVVACADISCNSELEVVRRLSSAANELRRIHRVVLMVELGDLREGIMPCDLESAVRETLSFPNICLEGIGANLACQSGAAPDAKNMAKLSAMADSINARFGLTVRIVSGGNSANLDWVLGGAAVGRINDLRLGESILLGCETLRRRPIEGLHTDAIKLIGEVIESKLKPSQPWGKIAETAFGVKPTPTDRGPRTRSLIAIGLQDTDTSGLQPPAGVDILGASSDHLIVSADGRRLQVGDEVAFRPNYSALVRAMTSPFVTRIDTPESSAAGNPLRRSASASHSLGKR